MAEKALQLAQTKAAADHPGMIASLDALALVYQAQGRYADAEALLQRALTMIGVSLDPDHVLTAEALEALALHFKAQGRAADEQAFSERAVLFKETNHE